MEIGLYQIREDNGNPLIQKRKSFEDIISAWDSITKEVIIHSFVSYSFDWR